MVKKSDENSLTLALNETVGENYSPTSRYVQKKKNTTVEFVYSEVQETLDLSSL